MPLLEISNLCRSFGGLRAVNDVSFGVEQGCIKGLIGPNGAGKTTFFNLVSGALRADSGAVRFNGAPIHNRPPHVIAKMGILRTFQNIKLFARMNVLENVMVGMHTKGRAGFCSGMLGLPGSRSEDRRMRERSREILGDLGLANLANADATSLAFGQQRYVELARALAGAPRLLLLDEPAAGLNMKETEDLGVIIRAMRDRGITILLVEHDMSLVMSISDDICVLSFGEVIAQGKPREIQKNPDVIRVYLGDDDA